MKDHAKTTFVNIKDAFETLKKQTGYNWEQDWKYSNSEKSVYFLNKKTGQQVYFASFDKYDSITGLTLGTQGQYWSRIWLEEPIQKNDGDSQTISDEDLVTNFQAIISTCFRGKLPPKASRKILISYNDWRPDSKFKQTFLPSEEVQKNEKMLVQNGKQYLYNPNAFEGQGALWVFAGVGINEFLEEEQRQFYRALKKQDIEMYKVMVLGLGFNMEGTAYGENLAKVHKLQEIEKGYLIFGIDYSSTKDESVVTAMIISKNFWKLQVVDVWTYKDKERGIGEKLTDPQQIQQMWKFMVKTAYKYKRWTEGKARIFVDSKDVVVRSYLNEYWKNSSYRDMFIGAQKASKYGITGKVIRVHAVRLLMGMERIFVHPRWFNWYISEWKKRILLKNGNVKDGNDDASQSFEYCISNMFKQIFTGEQLKYLASLIGVQYD